MIAVGDWLLRGLAIFFVVMAIIFVHEFGHYFVGRWCGVRASVFSLGFGPQIVGYKDGRGTQWRLALIPFGGYVKFVGDGKDISSFQSSSHVEDSLASVQIWKRVFTVFAGPLFNVLFAIVILTFFFFIYGRVAIEPVVGSLVKDSPAFQVGLGVGDRFIEMDGRQVESFEDLVNYVTRHGKDPIEFKIERTGRVFTTVIIPKIIKRNDEFGNQFQNSMIGVGVPVDPSDPTHLDPAYIKYVRHNFLKSIKKSINYTTIIITKTIFFVSRLIGGKEDLCGISGPPRIAKVAWKVSETGFVSLLNFTAFLSISIGLVNLFPLPPLDGGQLLFHVLEVFTGKSVSVKIQAIIFCLGIFILLCFIIFAFFNDYFCWFS